MDKLVKALKNPRLALFLLVEKLSFLFSDKIYLQLCFYLKMGKKLNLKHPVTFNGEFYQFNLSSCIRQQNSLTAQFVSFSLSNLANIFYPPQFLQ